MYTGRCPCTPHISLSRDSRRTPGGGSIDDPPMACPLDRPTSTWRMVLISWACEVGCCPSLRSGKRVPRFPGHSVLGGIPKRTNPTAWEGSDVGLCGSVPCGYGQVDESASPLLGAYFRSEHDCMWSLVEDRWSVIHCRRLRLARPERYGALSAFLQREKKKAHLGAPKAITAHSPQAGPYHLFHAALW